MTEEGQKIFEIGALICKPPIKDEKEKESCLKESSRATPPSF
jgi:hypothetical protein